MESPSGNEPMAGVRPSVPMALQAREFLSFKLGDEEYGIDILKVQEIRGYEKPTRMAGVPAFIKGVVNLASVEYNEFTVVIILNVLDRVVGIVVDGVSDVVALSSEQIKPAPEFSDNLEACHVIGLGTLDERMLILMDIEKLVASSDMGLVSKLAMH